MQQWIASRTESTREQQQNDTNIFCLKKMCLCGFEKIEISLLIYCEYLSDKW